MTINKKLFTAGLATILASSAIGYKALDTYFDSARMHDEATNTMELMESDGFSQAYKDSLLHETVKLSGKADFTHRISRGYNDLGLLVLVFGSTLILGSYKPD